jgi:hypothetical protein
VASSLRRGLFEAEDLLLGLWTIGFERLAAWSRRVRPSRPAGATVDPGPWVLRFASDFVALASSSLVVSRTLTT